ncbi:MAG TPA: hypothetical protein PKE51_12245 [Gemmatimonadaceae bacterium]|nr:hypothetical protein [Gemmatimonadaceae bacterium]
MFDDLREALRGFGRTVDPSDRRAALASMKDALVHARLALQDLRAAVQTTERRLAAEREELATVVRRRGLAEQVGDQETVAVAERFVAQHAERVRVLEQKHAAQLDELSLAEREYDAMSRDLKRAMAGLPLGSASVEAAAMREVEEALGESPLGSRSEADAMSHAQRREAREASAAERLAELKRKLGRD